MFIQSLSAKLGIATGQSLPAVCRDHLPRPVTWLLWAQGELVAVCTDLAEFLGGAIALNLLFGTPLVPAALITAAVPSALLMLAPRRRRRYEAAITGLLAVVCAGFLDQAVLAGHFGAAVHGLAPRLAGQGSVLQAGNRAALRASRIDIITALGIAGLVNMAMMTVAATALRGRSASSLPGIHASLATALSGGAATAFALALLASGLASSSVGIQAGQVIMGALVNRRSTTIAAVAVTAAVLALNAVLLAQA